MHEGDSNRGFARSCDWNLCLSGLKFKIPYWEWAYTLHTYLYNIYYMHEFFGSAFFDRGEYIVVKVIGNYKDLGYGSIHKQIFLIL